LSDELKIFYAGSTDVGRKRAHNEDNFDLLPDENLFVVCDGMGGHASGEVASKIAVDSLQDFFTATAKDPDKTWPFKEDRTQNYEANRLMTAIRFANRNIHDKAAEDMSFKGMGTTIVALCFFNRKVAVAHVGDSRCYRIRNGVIEQLTEDHSLLNDYKKQVQLTPEEEANFPHKNIIVRALGMKRDVVVDVAEELVEPGDIFLACSDGLNGEITDDQMLEIVLANGDDLETSTDQLIKAACDHGGKDNVTVVMAGVK